jgi:hypothetical protein
VSSSRQICRLDSITRSPVYSNFGETIQGLSSIRACNVQQRFIDKSDRLLDRNQSCYFASFAANRLDKNLITLNKIFHIEIEKICHFNQYMDNFRQNGTYLSFI